MADNVDEHVEMYESFVAEVHDGRVPFPWQSHLVRRILTERRWPDGIDVPTGLGKTATLDIAVFIAAVAPELSRRRVYLVVNRRIVVDEAFQHATRIAAALHAGSGPVAKVIAEALRQPGDDGPVLSVTRMRGGVTWDRLWLPRPDRYAIVTGTVDQIGSRLLFRGYGVSAAGRPIDAALTGTDSLIFLDEAHLAEPFRTTLSCALAASSGDHLRKPVLVSMSATPIVAGTVHTISPADETHPVAGKRLHAPKKLQLVEVKPSSKAKADLTMARSAADAVRQLAAPGEVTGAIVNTVARARALYNLLAAESSIDAILLIGRCRGVDRERWMIEHYPKVQVGRCWSSDRALILVATQTAEVGANIDLDSLVTESAPLGSLTQRLGRLNRLGSRNESTAVVLHDVTVGDDDPVYGPARQATWNYLSSLPPEICASPASLRNLARDAPDGLNRSTPYTPVLLPPILHSWVRTSPAPHPDTPVAPYLHGVDSGSAPVTIIWRSGLALTPVALSAWIDVINPLPPTADEGIEVSIAAVKRWLERGADDPYTTDIEGTPDGDTPDEVQTHRFRHCDRYGNPQVLHWPSNDDAAIISVGQIRPGMTIIVPAEYGGCDQYGWSPNATDPVVDVADLAMRASRGASAQAAVLRVGPTLDALGSAYHGLLSDPDGFAATAAQLRTTAAAYLDGDPIEPTVYRECLARLRDNGPDPATPLGRTLVILASGRVRITPWTPSADDLWTPDNASRPWDVLITVGVTELGDDETAAASSACCGVALGLDAHQHAVAQRAAEFAENLGLPAALARAVATAGRWHDEGKRDPRFQAMLHGGNPLAAELAGEPLAKSGMDPADRAAFNRARRRSGYPRGKRHEDLSQRIAAHQLAGYDGDLDLVCHLIAAHHGHSRPLLPAVTDPDTIQIGLDDSTTIPSHAPVNLDSADRFANLNDRYGTWGLAMLETIVRLADTWASARNEGHDLDPS